MRTSDKGLALIKECEGYMKRRADGGCEAYQEVLGHRDGKPILDIPTIGWGCTKGVTMGMVWTVDEATEALRRELEEHERIVQRVCTVDLTQGQFDSLVSFNFNTGKLPKSTLLKKLNAGDVEGAADEFRAFNRAGGKVQPGLVRRRSLEKALFLEPDGDERHAAPQTVDTPRRKLSTAEKVAAGAVAGEGALQGARAAVNKGQEIKSIAVDARGLMPSMAVTSSQFLGAGFIVAAVAVVVLVVVRARG